LQDIVRHTGCEHRDWSALLKFEVDRAELAQGTIPEILKSPHLIIEDVLTVQSGLYRAALRLESFLVKLDDHEVQGSVLNAAEALNTHISPSMHKLRTSYALCRGFPSPKTTTNRPALGGLNGC